jgi:OPA family sugar phosphate sensor protein UhpC-like MFS transporter
MIGRMKRTIHNNKRKLFWHIWSSYAIYYLGRANLSIIIPVLLATQGLSKYHLGLVASGFFFAYAIGQFLHGQLSEKFNPYTYLAVGLIGSAIMNALLGFSGAFFWILFIGEIMDGGFQSMGWSSAVRANAEMQKEKKIIEKKSTILGTSYQIGNSIAWLLSAFFVGWLGWEWGFWVAAIIMFLRGITLLIIRPKVEVKKRPAIKQLKHTLKLPIIISGFGMALLNMIRYGVIIWIPTYLVEQGSSIISVGLKIFLIPIAGVFGTLAYNKLKKNRSILTAIFISCLGILFAVFGYMDEWLLVGALILSGFFLYGPHVFLVSTFPSRFVDKKIVASSTGFIDGMAYIGAIIIGLLVPFLLDITNNNWNIVFLSWSVLCLFIIVLVMGMHFYMKKDGRVAKEADVLDYPETKEFVKY